MKNNLVNQDIKTDKPVPMSYEALKADRDAQKKLADALAVRNEKLMSFVVEVFNIAAQHCTLNREEIHALGERLELFGHETYQPVLHGYHIGLESGESRVYVIKNQPADAAIAAIEARGVEKAAVKMQESGAQTFGDCYIALAQYATELREAK